jgi:hypothetical protein
MLNLIDLKERESYLKNVNMLLVECLLAFGVLSQDFKGNVYIIRPESLTYDSAVVFHSLRDEPKKWRRIKLKDPAKKQTLGSVASMFKNSQRQFERVSRRDADFDLIEREHLGWEQIEANHILHIGLPYNKQCRGILRIETGEVQDLERIERNPSLPMIAARLGFWLCVEEKISVNRK